MDAPAINIVAPAAGSEADSEDTESLENPTVRITRLLQAALTHAPLVKVNLSKCGLDSRSFGPLAQVLSTRPGIQMINVSHNHLENTSVPDICSLLLRISSLMELNLCSN